MEHLRPPTVVGHVAPGYEPVRELFRSHLEWGLEEHVQCCAFVNGVKVVDLHGSAVAARAHSGRYDAASTQNIFSSTKAVTSLVVAMLEDRGYLRYDQLVEEIWPEYAQNGKAGTTIAHVMRHEAGIPNFNLRARDLTTDKIKAGAVSDKIAGLRPKFPNKSRDIADRARDPAQGGWRAYHATTRGWIVNEIVRRVDPQGRTVGTVPLASRHAPHLQLVAGHAAHNIPHRAGGRDTEAGHCIVVGARGPAVHWLFDCGTACWDCESPCGCSTRHLCCIILKLNMCPVLYGENLRANTGGFILLLKLEDLAQLDRAGLSGWHSTSQVRLDQSHARARHPNIRNRLQSGPHAWRAGWRYTRGRSAASAGYGWHVQ